MQQLLGASREALLKEGDALPGWVLLPACSRCSGRAVDVPSSTDRLLPAEQWPTCSETGLSTLLAQDFPAQLPKAQGTSHCTVKLTTRLAHLHSKPGVGNGDSLTLFTFSSNQKTLPRYLPVQQKYLLFLDISSVFSSCKLQEGWVTQCTLSSKEAFYYCSAKLGREHEKHKAGSDNYLSCYAVQDWKKVALSHSQMTPAVSGAGWVFPSSVLLGWIQPQIFWNRTAVKSGTWLCSVWEYWNRSGLKK